jgi:hypothetical protein
MIPEPALALQKITHHTPNRDAHLSRVLALSNTIFSPDPSTKYASLDIWRTRLADPSSVVLYLVPNSSTGEEEDPIAFVFAHPREHAPPLSTGETRSLHVWLAGVQPKYRRAGCLDRMLRELYSGATVLTVCTVPETYPEMWAWLCKRGWRVEREVAAGKPLLAFSPTE